MPVPVALPELLNYFPSRKRDSNERSEMVDSNNVRDFELIVYFN